MALLFCPNKCASVGVLTFCCVVMGVLHRFVKGNYNVICIWGSAVYYSITFSNRMSFLVCMFTIFSCNVFEFSSDVASAALGLHFLALISSSALFKPLNRFDLLFQYVRPWARN